MFNKLFEKIEAAKLADRILETYKRVETDESYFTGSDSVSTPIATLADEWGGRAQIGIDDGCYVLYLLQEDGSYKHTAWIFPEAHEVLKDLPDPEEVEPVVPILVQEEQEDKSVTKSFKITTATPDTMRRFERFLSLLHYNGGHSGIFAMSFDGDGHEKMKVDPPPDKELAKGKDGVAGADVELVREDDEIPFAAMFIKEDSGYNVDRDGNKVEE